MSELSDKEKKISQAAVWVWRNLLASGVFLACFWFLYDKLSDVEHKVIEVRTVVQERIRIDRGDYGWAEPAFESDDNLFPEEPSEEKMEEGLKVRQHIDNFANGE